MSIHNAVCVQNFMGLYFREFRESTGDRENVYAYGISLLLQATFREIKIKKIVRCTTHTPHTHTHTMHHQLTAYTLANM